MFSLLNGLLDDLKLHAGFCSLKIFFISAEAIPFLNFIDFSLKDLQIFAVQCYKIV